MSYIFELLMCITANRTVNSSQRQLWRIIIEGSLQYVWCKGKLKQVRSCFVWFKFTAALNHEWHWNAEKSMKILTRMHEEWHFSFAWCSRDVILGSTYSMHLCAYGPDRPCTSWRDKNNLLEKSTYFFFFFSESKLSEGWWVCSSTWDGGLL